MLKKMCELITSNFFFYIYFINEEETKKKKNVTEFRNVTPRTYGKVNRFGTHNTRPCFQRETNVLKMI